MLTILAVINIYSNRQIVKYLQMVLKQHLQNTTPFVEPSFLYGGYPCKDLRHKFLLASASDVKEISDSDFPQEN